MREVRAVQTNDIGKRTTAHLNLTRSLADAWGLSEADVAKVRKALDHKPPEPWRVPYAGKHGVQV